MTAANGAGCWIVQSHLQRAALHHSPYAGPDAEGSGLKRQDTPWPGWQEAAQQGGGTPQGSGGQPEKGKGQRRQPRQKAGRPGVDALEEEGPSEGPAQGTPQSAVGKAAGGGGGASPAAVGTPPEHPHHAGKPPAPLLDAEHGSVADDLIPPQEPAEP